MEELRSLETPGDPEPILKIMDLRLRAIIQYFASINTCLEDISGEKNGNERFPENIPTITEAKRCGQPAWCS